MTSTDHRHHDSSPPHAEHAGHGSPAGSAVPDEHDRHAPTAAPSGSGHHAGHAPGGTGGAHAAHGAPRPDAEHAGHDKHAGHSVAMFRDRFWLSFALTIPTLIWSDLLQRWLGYSAPAFPGSAYIPAAFGTIVYFYGGWPFLEGAWRELRARLPGMMTLISLAISVAFLFSLAVELGVRGMSLWWELATLVTIMLLGHWIEMRSITQAQGALKELAKLLPNTAERVGPSGSVETVPIGELRDADIVLVRPGGAIAADGTVREGSSDVNESMITGESRPVRKQAGDPVIAGTVNGGGSLRIEVTGTGDHTALARIMRLVSEAQSSRSRAQALADRAAFFLTLVAVVSAAITLVVWLTVADDAAFAVERVVTVLVIACPHALGLAIPLVVAISTTLGARSGLLVRDRRGLEEARSLTAVVFDKTGTLTLGQHRVVDVVTTGGLTETEALRLAAAIEQDSEHPIARAIVASARERSLDLPAVSGFEAIAGRGVSATLDGRTLTIGGPNLLAAEQARVDDALGSAADQAAARGESAVFLLDRGRPVAAFAIADAIRPESREAIDRLHREGIEVVMITGDAQAVADAVARDLGIDRVLAQVLPEHKAARITDLQQRGNRVAMVGDGVNDAPALVTADVGIAIGAGTDVAVEAGDVVLVRSDPRDVPRIIKLSKATYRKMIQNLWWAAGYNIVAIPLAAGVLAPWGIVLHPALGAVFMSASTIIVALNAQLLRRISL